jgi:predicted metal-dependent peptidase
VWNAPGFRHIWYKLLNNNDGNYVAVPTKSVPIAATDAKNIMINPDEFFKMSLAERTFVMGHEIVHNVYGDVDLLKRCHLTGRVPQMDGTTLPFHDEYMQEAMDLRINALLVKSRIGKMPMRDGKPFGHLDTKMDGSESVFDVYGTIYKDRGDPPPGGGNGNPGGFDNLLPPGTSTPGQSTTRNPGQWQVEVARAAQLEDMKSQGKTAGALARLFKEILEPEVDWREHIRTLINRIGNSGGWNWRQPDEWWSPHEFFSPRKSGKGAGWIAIWGDTSGSMGDQEIARAIAEVGGILEDVNPARLTVLWCDAEIDNIDEIESAADLAHVQARGVGGGGGTSVHPVIDWLRKQDDKPDLFIGITDGYVSFPDAPPFPVIWASTTKDVAYPYGEVVRINKKACE